MPSVTLALCLFLSFGGYQMWLDKERSIRASKTVTTSDIDAIRFIDEQRDTLSVESWKGKVVVLYFWTTNCSNCFKEFPLLQKIYNRDKDNSKFVLYAVNNPSKGDNKDRIFSMLRKRGYTFPVLLACDSTASLLKKIREYPTVFLFYGGDFSQIRRIKGVEKKIDWWYRWHSERGTAQDFDEPSDASVWAKSMFVKAYSDSTIASTFSGDEILNTFIISTDDTKTWTSYGNVHGPFGAVEIYNELLAKYGSNCFEIKAEKEVDDWRYMYHRACSK
jgi:thiol-disulfide isomerase/thioredoxin